MTADSTGMKAVATVDATTLRAWLTDGEEVALVDVRDGGPFSRSHLLVACNIPLAQLELKAPELLPRRDSRIVLIDDAPAEGQNSAQRAAALLSQHGYRRLSILEGGTSGWGACGFELFSGTNVPSKAFGEHVEHTCETPRIDPDVLHQWQQEGRDIVLVDSRPADEFRTVSLPGASNCPGAELVLRVPGLVRSEKTIVVVNCAGRTRSIIGTQSLRNAGLPNPVYALKNGTMGWELAGFKADHGREDLVPAPQGAALAQARQMADDVAERYGVSFIDRNALRSMQAESHRTTHVFDVRQPAEFAAGHMPGSLNAPGGQLVQATDTFVVTRGARIVLVDSLQVQSVMTAHWLIQMGWRDVHVLKDGLSAEDGLGADGQPGLLETGPVRTKGLGEAVLPDQALSPQTLHAQLKDGAVTVIDVGDSFRWRRGHVPGSGYAMRSHLPQVLGSVSLQRPLVFVCADGRLSRFAAQDARTLGYAAVSTLAGGRSAWLAAGLPTETCTTDDDPKLLTPTDDMWYPPYARTSAVQEAMQQYLTWEVNLLEQLAREPYLTFSAP
jgi:rhodanese-related sulfurtransferase